MKGLSVVIPTWNEEHSIKTLLTSLAKILQKQNIKYELLVVDDHSNDKTPQIVKKVARSYPVKLFVKEGKKGKATSLLEGFSYSKYETLAMIDADMQYPPEAVGSMYKKIEQGTDIVLSNRANYKDSKVRKLTSRTFRFIFGKVLFGLSYDVQSGLKVFQKRVLKSILFRDTSGWSFDLDFLYQAKNHGYTIESHDITFEPRRSGDSKIKVVKAAFEMSIDSIKLWLDGKRPFYIGPDTKKGMTGAGIRHNGKEYITHTTLPNKISALTTFTRGQKTFFTTLLALFIAGLVVNPLQSIQVIVATLSVIYFLDTIFNLGIIWRSIRKKQEITFNQKEIDSLKKKDLPIYSILCPLYKEAHIIPQFIESIEKLDWPKDKLDVLLLLEEDDRQTQKAARQISLPSYVRIVVVPESAPKTKPKACNYGLSLAKGEYLVIYDAEDMPDVDQLKKAYLAFQKSPQDIACFQAKLNYYNADQNILTRLFTAEYSLWFDVTLPGYQSIQTAIPLGGTSNHFRTALLKDLRGWDPFNVTEDADLGIRLFMKGYKTAIIDSTTWEEANSNVSNWVRQRSRWIKGYMQTYLVHMRSIKNIMKLRREHALLFQLIVGGKLAFVLINPLLWIATASYFLLYKYVGPSIESVYPSMTFYIAVASLVFGNFLFLYYYMIGCAKREQWSLIKYIFLVPFYWILLSTAGFIAFYQLLFKPHYWEKTIHGLHLKQPEISDESEQRRILPRISIPDISWRPIVPGISLYSSILPVSLPLGFRVLSTLAAGITTVVVDSVSSILALIKRLFATTGIADEEYNRRILIFNWRDIKHKWAGGAEVYLHNVAREWVREGSFVTMFTGNDGSKNTEEYIDGVHVVRKGNFCTVYLWAFFYYIFKFRGKYDCLVDSENGIPFFTPLYSFEPVILLIHHIHQDVFQQHLKFPLNKFAMFLEKTVMPLIYRNTQIVTVSKSSREDILSLNTQFFKDVDIVNPGISSEMFSKQKKTSYPSFAYVGRIKPHKNLNIALHAFARVATAFSNARFSIVGDGEKLQELRGLTHSLNIADKVEFLGRVSDKKKAEILAKSWVCLQPSQVEGWGITVIEANASGTPVIASNVEGLRDSVQNGKTGILVKLRDVDELAKAMLGLTLDKKYLHNLSKNALSYSKRFSWEKSAYTFSFILDSQINKVRAYRANYSKNKMAIEK